MGRWYEKSFRRNLVDMHIEDWDQRFMAKFSPQVYVENMKRAQVQSCMIYANSHVGHCYWPTKIGHVHANMKKGDWFGETVDLTHQAGMDAVAYYTLIFVNDEYEAHPEWQVRTLDGQGMRDLQGFMLWGGRYGTVCPNNMEYREYVDRHVAELISGYELEGIFFDMNFWPLVCYCDSCRTRYKKEAGKEIPVTVDWSDPEWLEFVKVREDWIVESAKYFENIVKKRKPDMTVEHNFAPFMMGWFPGITDGMADAVDFNSGDFYGKMSDQNFICKMHNTMTKNLPFEFMTSRCYPSLFDHTSIKAKEMLYLENCLALANGGAFFFIDAINPDGTMCSEIYELMGEIFEETKRYEPFMGGRIKADVAVYFSTNSRYNPADQPRSTDSVIKGGIAEIFSNTIPHPASSVSAGRNLKENHVPYTVLTKKNLENLDQYSILIVSNIARLDEKETEMIKEWVAGGGKLYITSMIPQQLVMELLNIEYEGVTESYVTYVYPTDEGRFIVDGTLNQTSPIGLLQPQARVKVKGNAKVLAYVGVPYTNPADPVRFASIHSNPPAESTNYPAMVLGKYGKGEVFWSSVAFEAADPEYVSQNKVFNNIIRKMINKPPAFKSDASPYIDFTLIDQKDKSRYLMSFVNLQDGIPKIPLHDVEVSVNTEGRDILKVCTLPDEEEVEFTVTDGYVDLHVKTLKIFEAMLIYYA